jgi:flagellar biosynthesis protein FlhB
MAEEKTFEASDHKIKKARKKGQVAVSQDATRIVRYAILFEVLFGLAASWKQVIVENLEKSIDAVSKPAAYRNGVILDMLYAGSIPMAVITSAAAAITVILIVVQTQFVIATEAYSTGMEKLNPASSLKSIFTAQKFTNVLLAPLKLGIVMIVGSLQIYGLISQILQIYLVGLDNIFPISYEYIRSVNHAALATLLVIAIIDFAITRFMYKRGQKMSFDELKRDMKETEGNMEAKGQQRSVRHELAQEEPNVGEADVVAVNPFHIAVALSYDRSLKTLPVLVAKGANKRAEQIRLAARVHRIPIIRYEELARILYASGREGTYVPFETARAVGLLYRALRELHEQDRAYIDDRIEVAEIDPEMGRQMFSAFSGNKLAPPPA